MVGIIPFGYPDTGPTGQPGGRSPVQFQPGDFLADPSGNPIGGPTGPTGPSGGGPTGPEGATGPAGPTNFFQPWVIGFGADMTTTGGSARVNGEADSAEIFTAPSSLREAAAPMGATTVIVAWNVTTLGGNVWVYVNGVGIGAGAITLSTAKGTASQAVSLSSGDLVQIRHTGGPAPGVSNFQIMFG